MGGPEEGFERRGARLKRGGGGASVHKYIHTYIHAYLFIHKCLSVHKGGCQVTSSVSVEDRWKPRVTKIKMKMKPPKKILPIITITGDTDHDRIVQLACTASI